MRPDTPPEQSYFQNQLKVKALREDVAAPVTIADLEKQITYLRRKQRHQVRRAYDIANEAHAKQLRRTGHAYITHPLAVASTLAQHQVDGECVIAALLHDVLEDSAHTEESIQEEFGSDVAAIVAGVSKISHFDNNNVEDTQAANFQALLVAAATDIRVILVKLADRLHNMQTLGVMSKAKRHRIAQETMEIYAPIADRLGIHSFKNQLEDLAFEILYPVRSDHIDDAIQKFRTRNEELVSSVRERLQAHLKAEKLSVEVLSHERHLYSIYESMRHEGIRFKEIMNVFAFDIIVTDVNSCYLALGAVHSQFRPKVDSFKDYIAIPKVNGYQSLHTSIFTPENIPIKLHIRTRDMHRMALHGILSKDFQPKVGDATKADKGRSRADVWIRQVIELHKMAGDPKEFLASLKLDLFQREVYVFTPDGELVELPHDATAIDFAFAIHSDIGNFASSCTIDDKEATLNTRLRSGQTVEIMTDPNARPNAEWLNHITSAKARAAIRHTLLGLAREERRELGESLLKQKLKRLPKRIEELDDELVLSICREFQSTSLDELLIRIGGGQIQSAPVANAILNAVGTTLELAQDESAITVRGGESQSVAYAECCGPIPGDRVKGIMQTGRGLIVHREKCTHLKQRERQASVDGVAVEWNESTSGRFKTAITLVTEHSPNVLASVASSLSKQNAEIHRLHVAENPGATASVMAHIGIKDLDHLKRITKALRSEAIVNSISRHLGEVIEWQVMPSTPRKRLRP